jgi:hypothetical protein
LRPRTIVGTANVPTAALATTFPNWRRVGRTEVEENLVPLMESAPWLMPLIDPDASLWGEESVPLS